MWCQQAIFRVKSLLTPPSTPHHPTQSKNVEKVMMMVEFDLLSLLDLYPDSFLLIIIIRKYLGRNILEYFLGKYHLSPLGLYPDSLLIIINLRKYLGENILEYFLGKYYLSPLGLYPDSPPVDSLAH